MGLGGFLPPVVAEFRGDITDLKAKSLEARAEVRAMADEGSANFNKFAAVGKTALLGLGAVAVGVAIAGVAAADKWEGAHARLETAVKNSGSTWEQWGGNVSNAESKAEKLGFTNADVENSLAKLVPVTKSQGQATSDLALAEDIARARHMDLEAATQLLVKVQTGHVSLLGRLGINTKDATGATISQEEALRRLTALYGGNASAYAGTFAGKMEVVKAEAEDLAKNIGVAVIPIVEKFVGTLADGANWLVQHKDAAIALGVVIGGPLVAAMAAYVVQQAIAIGSGIIGFWGSLVGRVVAVASSYEMTDIALAQNTTELLINAGATEAEAAALLSLDAAGTSTIATLGAIAVGLALPVAAAFALGYGLHTLMGGFDDVYGAFHRGEDAGKALADSWVTAANKTDHPIRALRDDLSALNVDHQQHLAAIRADGGGFDQAAQEALRYHTAQVAVKKAIADTSAEHQKSLIVTKQVAQSYGVEIPNAGTMTTQALKSVQSAIAGASDTFSQGEIQASLWADNTGAALTAAKKDADNFASSIASSFSKATDPFAHFGNQATVTEGDMESFFVGGNLAAQNWSSELGGIIDRVRTELPAGTKDAVTGLVQEMAKAGPDSKPSLDAFVQMVDQHGVGWVNSMAQSSADAQAKVDAAYNEMAITAAIKSAEIAAVGKAAFQDLQEGGTRHLEGLETSSDKALAGMAYGAILHLGDVRGAVQSIPTVWFTTFGADASGVWAAVQSAKAALATLPTGYTGGQSLLQWTLDHPGQPLPGAHGLVGLAHGGSAGTIVGPNQPVVIGEGLSREAVVPFDNFGDMVTTIRNTGRASDFARASIRAGGIPPFTPGAPSASGDAGGITQLVGAGVGAGTGGGEVHTHYHEHIHAGYVITERELVDLVQEGLRKNTRQGRGSVV